MATTKAPVEGEIVQESVQTQSNQTNDYLAIASIVMGIINLCAWFLPLCGCPFTIIGIVLSIFGMKSTKYSLYAKIGLGLSIFGFVLTIFNAVLGVVFQSSDFLNNI